jgi:hypothetical protein
MRPKKKLYRCHTSVYMDAHESPCGDIGTNLQCPDCRGEDIYVLKPRKKKAKR